MTDLHLRNDPKQDPMRVEYYEGLVGKTAGKYCGVVREEDEDLRQILYLKVWQALQSYNADRATQSVQGYVFSCVRNQIKDLLKRKRRDEMYIEDIAPSTFVTDSLEGRGAGRERFEGQYLSEDDEQAFADVLAEIPLIPSTLSENERHVVVCLYLEYGQAEIAETLKLSRREVARCVRGVKEKMADWRPSQGEREEQPVESHQEREPA